MSQREREVAYGVDHVEHKELVDVYRCERKPTLLTLNTISPAPRRALLSGDLLAPLKAAPTSTVAIIRHIS